MDDNSFLNSGTVHYVQRYERVLTADEMYTIFRFSFAPRFPLPERWLRATYNRRWLRVRLWKGKPFPWDVPTAHETDRNA